MGNNFIIRVYGIYLDDLNGLLVSDEIVRGDRVTKLPGGGLEYGEGTIDCLKREMIEETGYEFDVSGHFYTTDFFLESAYHPNHQIISIYYLMKPKNKFGVKISSKAFQFESEREGAQAFRYIPLSDLNVNEFTYPIDSVVIGMLIGNRK
jgi:8-oxo-dGTP diphosphatase